MDNKPVLFKIYGGKVTGLKDFGAFVTLEGVSGRVEGTFTILIIPFSDSDIFGRYGSRLEHSGWSTRKFPVGFA